MSLRGDDSQGVQPAVCSAPSRVERLIPGYASLARLSVSLLAASPLAHQEGAAVLVAGCGSGAELMEAQALRPDWTLTALDPSRELLAVARRSVEQFSGGSDSPPSTPLLAPPIRWMEGTVEDLSPEPVFDGAMAVLVLQGIPDDGGKLNFLASLSRSLRSGAQVVLVDQMQPERNGIEAQLLEARRIFQGPSPLDGRGEPGMDELGEVHAISLSRLSGLLEAVGFSDPLPVFRALDVEGFLVQRLS